MILPYIEKPQPDELLYGWLHYMTEMNGLRTPVELLSVIRGTKALSKPTTKDIALCYTFEMESLCERLDNRIDVDTVMRRMTPFYQLFPFLSLGQQAEKSQGILRDKTGGILDMPKGIHDFHTLHVCPLCMKEDIKATGRPYLHTWHQTAKICAKHGTVLSLVKLSYNTSHYLDEVFLESMEEEKLVLPVDIERKIAKLMYDMYEKPLNISQTDTQRIIRTRMNKLGYPQYNYYDEIINDMNAVGYEPILRNNNRPVSSKHLIKSTDASTTLFISLIAFLFKDYNDFYQAAFPFENSEKDDFCRCIKGKYEMLSDYGQTVLLHNPETGNTFHIHPHAIILGFEDPMVMEKMSDEEQINHMLSHVGDGEYVAVTDSSDWRTEQKILHKTCGKIRNDSFFRVIFNARSCKCEFHLTNEKLQQMIDPNEEEFIVLKHESLIGGTVITLKHKVCGQIFKVTMSQFKENNSCRVCGEINNEARFRKELETLLGDEYELASSFRGFNQPIMIRHRLCGTITELSYASEIRDGVRCRLCTPDYCFDDVNNILKEATDGMAELIGDKNHKFPRIRYPDGHEERKPLSFIMQELTQNNDSEVLPVKHKVTPPISDKGRLYLEIKKHCEKDGVWRMAGYQNLNEQEYKILCGRVYWLTQKAYIEKIRPGIYKLSGTSIPEDMLKDCRTNKEKVYDSIKEECEQNGVWDIKNHNIKSESDSDKLSHALRGLSKTHKIICVDKGRYIINENISSITDTTSFIEPIMDGQSDDIRKDIYKAIKEACEKGETWNIRGYAEENGLKKQYLNKRMTWLINHHYIKRVGRGYYTLADRQI